MRLAIILHALLAAAPLAAQNAPPLPECAIDPETEVLRPAHDPRGGVPVWPSLHPGEVVLFDWPAGPQAVAGIVQHCPTGQTLRWQFRAEAAEVGRAAIRAMLDSPVVHGFDDLRSEVRYHGGRARQVASPGRCACEAVRAAGS